MDKDTEIVGLPLDKRSRENETIIDNNGINVFCSLGFPYDIPWGA